MVIDKISHILVSKCGAIKQLIYDAEFMVNPAPFEEMVIAIERSAAAAVMERDKLIEYQRLMGS